MPKHRWPARRARSCATRRASAQTCTSVGTRPAATRGHQPVCSAQSGGRVRTSTSRGAWRATQNSQILRRSSIMSLGKRVKEANGRQVGLGGSGGARDGLGELRSASSLDSSIVGIPARWRSRRQRKKAAGHCRSSFEAVTSAGFAPSGRGSGIRKQTMQTG